MAKDKVTTFTGKRSPKRTDLFDGELEGVSNKIESRNPASKNIIGETKIKLIISGTG